MRRLAPHHTLALIVLFSVAVVASSSGCAVLYQLAYGDGHKIPAKFPGLKGKRVAVVCTMNPSTYGDGALGSLIADRVGQVLAREVDDIEVVRQDEVADWMDTNDWDDSDFKEIGRGVNAEMVVGVVVNDFSVHEPGSKTLLKGHAGVTITVYDIQHGGKNLFRTTNPSYTFPESHSVPAISNADARDFQRTFLELLAGHIAKNFYDYDFAEDFAPDGAAYAQ